MYEIARVTLENEMDLILGHRRSMRLAELTGLSLPSQTSFATAVSEIARNAIERQKKGCLVLHVMSDKREHFIIARIHDEETYDLPAEGWKYAKRLVNKLEIQHRSTETIIDLYWRITPGFALNTLKIDEWRRLFRNEPAISPYEEMKRQHERLIELSEQVKESEARYKTLTNALPLAIFAIDQQGKMLYANDWLTTHTGDTVQTINRNGWSRLIHEDDVESWTRLLNLKDDAGTVQLRLKHKFESSWYWHQISLSPFRNEAGNVQYRIGSIVDIHAQKVVEETLKDNTELKETQKQLTQSILELNRSNRELEQFAYVASHDLQEPVRKILFYSDFLLSEYEQSLEGRGVQFLRTIQAASQRMRSLIQDILTFSQISKARIRFQSVDMNAVTQEVLQDLEMLIEEKGASIHVDPLHVVLGDSVMMRQLVSNLISNSLKYSRSDVPPRIDITCSIKTGSVIINFTDNGIGFDDKYIPQMFELFQRLHTRQQFDGTGLGLAICKKIIELHNGNISATGTLGAGASFAVTLPMADTEALAN